MPFVASVDIGGEKGAQRKLERYCKFYTSHEFKVLCVGWAFGGVR